jgi:hypothetical protein
MTILLEFEGDVHQNNRRALYAENQYFVRYIFNLCNYDNFKVFTFKKIYMISYALYVYILLFIF